jgi:hypothetical protein
MMKTNPFSSNVFLRALLAASAVVPSHAAIANYWNIVDCNPNGNIYMGFLIDDLYSQAQDMATWAQQRIAIATSASKI